MSVSRMAPMPLQAPPQDDGWLKLVGATILGVLATIAGFRATLAVLRRDIAGEKTARREHERKVAEDIAASERRMAESIGRIERMITEGHNADAVKKQREANESKAQLGAIGDRLHIMREQIFALVRLMVQMARATPGMNPSDVDDAMSRVMALEIKRVD